MRKDLGIEMIMSAYWNGEQSKHFFGEFVLFRYAVDLQKIFSSTASSTCQCFCQCFCYFLLHFKIFIALLSLLGCLGCLGCRTSVSLCNSCSSRHKSTRLSSLGSTVQRISYRECHECRGCECHVQPVWSLCGHCVIPVISGFFTWSDSQNRKFWESLSLEVARPDQRCSYTNTHWQSVPS